MGRTHGYGLVSCQTERCQSNRMDMPTAEQAANLLAGTAWGAGDHGGVGGVLGKAGQRVTGSCPKRGSTHISHRFHILYVNQSAQPWSPHPK